MTHFEIATAPVSFGIFGQHGGLSRQEAVSLVSAMAAAGFAGAELGPPGLVGTPEETAALFADHRLEVVGAYVSMHFAGPEHTFADDLAAFEQTCAELSAAGGSPRVILADEGDHATRSNPARSNDHPVRWDSEQWNLALGRIRPLIDRILELGLTPSFHPHVGTYVENEREIELLLARTEIGLTIDTGHLLLAGMEPSATLADYRDRVNHIHIKDVRLDGIPEPEVTQASDLDDWWADVASPLGDGDVDVQRFIQTLTDAEHRWLVIEQDRDPSPIGSLDQIGRAERANRRWLQDLIVAGQAGRPDDSQVHE